MPEHLVEDMLLATKKGHLQERLASLLAYLSKRGAEQFSLMKLVRCRSNCKQNYFACYKKRSGTVGWTRPIALDFRLVAAN